MYRYMIRLRIFPIPFAADIDPATGCMCTPVLVAGGEGAEESVMQPRWSPAGVLHFISDRNGWWNIYKVKKCRQHWRVSIYTCIETYDWSSLGLDIQHGVYFLSAHYTQVLYMVPTHPLNEASINSAEVLRSSSRATWVRG